MQRPEPVPWQVDGFAGVAISQVRRSMTNGRSADLEKSGTAAMPQ